MISGGKKKKEFRSFFKMQQILDIEKVIYQFCHDNTQAISKNLFQN